MPAQFWYEKNEAFDVLSDPDSSIIGSNTRMLVLAACVGYAHDRRVEDPGDNGPIRWNYIDQNSRMSVVVSALAYADHEAPEAILEPDLKIETLQCYGAGGARLMIEEIIEEPGSNLENLIEFVQETRDDDDMTDRVGILETIEADISTLPMAQD
jgi:hypothetical protein